MLADHHSGALDELFIFRHPNSFILDSDGDSQLSVKSFVLPAFEDTDCTQREKKNVLIEDDTYLAPNIKITITEFRTSLDGCSMASSKVDLITAHQHRSTGENHDEYYDNR